MSKFKNPYKPRRVLIINDCLGAGRLMLEAGWEIVSDFEHADMVLFTGGADINPALYGEPEHPKTYWDPRRDKVEVQAFKAALDMRIPMAGICRGAQLICAMNGDTLYQDVHNHAIGGTHAVKDLFTNETYRVTSLHHQMCRIGRKGVVLAIASPPLSNEKDYMSADGKIITAANDFIEAEAFYYAATNSFGFQGHPEMNAPKDCITHFFRYIEDYLFNGE